MEHFLQKTHFQMISAFPGLVLSPPAPRCETIAWIELQSHVHQSRLSQAEDSLQPLSFLCAFSATASQSSSGTRSATLANLTPCQKTRSFVKQCSQPASLPTYDRHRVASRAQFNFKILIAHLDAPRRVAISTALLPPDTKNKEAHHHFLCRVSVPEYQNNSTLRCQVMQLNDKWMCNDLFLAILSHTRCMDESRRSAECA